MDIKLPDNLDHKLRQTNTRVLKVMVATTVLAAVALLGGSILVLYIPWSKAQDCREEGRAERYGTVLDYQ
jgi:hypothetical protein